MPNDAHSTIADLKALVANFVSERGWEQFHTPKNLATSILIEAAELAEHFQWATPQEAETISESITSEHPIAQELADVLSYVIAIANRMNIDLADSLHAKMRRNAIKYPPAHTAPVAELKQPAAGEPAAPDVAGGSDVSRYPSWDGG